MKRFLTLLILVLMVGTTAFAQSLSQADRENAIKYLESTRQDVIDATQGLSADQWNFDPGTGAWPIAVEMEHIASAEDLYFVWTTQIVVKAPPHPAGDDVKAIDQTILAQAKVATDKDPARDLPAPSGRFESPEAALNHFLEARDQTIQFLRELKEGTNLRAHAIDSPVGKKKWDAYQWILFMAAHADQHTKRILELKADPNFPKTSVDPKPIVGAEGE